MNKKKKRIFYIFIIFILIISLVFTISYALFSYYRNGAKINQFYTADILYNFHEIENFVLKDVFPENYDYGTTQDDNLVSFSLNGNIQSGTLEYTISVIKGEDIEDLERLPGDALLISIQSTDESDVFETIAFDSEELVEDYIASKSLSELDTNDSMVLATGTLPSVPTIEHESFFVRIWVNDQKVMISDTICRNETTSKAANCNTTYVDEDGDTIQTYPKQNAIDNDMYIIRTNELENLYYSIKVNVDSNL